MAKKRVRKPKGTKVPTLRRPGVPAISLLDLLTNFGQVMPVIRYFPFIQVIKPSSQSKVELNV